MSKSWMRFSAEEYRDGGAFYELLTLPRGAELVALYQIIAFELTEGKFIRASMDHDEMSKALSWKYEPFSKRFISSALGTFSELGLLEPVKLSGLVRKECPSAERVRRHREKNKRYIVTDDSVTLSRPEKHEIEKNESNNPSKGNVINRNNYLFDNELHESTEEEKRYSVTNKALQCNGKEESFLSLDKKKGDTKEKLILFPSNEEEKENSIQMNLNMSERKKEGGDSQDSDITSSITAASEPKVKRFVRPSFDEVRAYCESRGNGVDPQAFLDFYDSKGWMIGKNHMKDWKAAVRTWERMRKSNPSVGSGFNSRSAMGRDIDRFDGEETEVIKL